MRCNRVSCPLDSELPIAGGMQGAPGILETRGRLGLAGPGKGLKLLPDPDADPAPVPGMARPSPTGGSRSDPSWHPARPYLDGSGGSRAAGPDLEEAGAGGGCLPAVAGRAALVDDHRFPAKQAHEVGGLLALDHAALAGTQEGDVGPRGQAPPAQQCGPAPDGPSCPRLHAAWTPSTREPGGCPGKAGPAPRPLPLCKDPPADPESCPGTKQTHVCKYSLK